MPRDPIQESWTGDAYKGFAGPPPQSAAPPPAATDSRKRNLMLGGLAGAVALGAVFGLLARPQLGDDRDRAPMQPVTAEAASTPVPVEVAQAEPQPLPTPRGKLEVLPPDLAQAAPRPVTIPAPAPRPPPLPQAPAAPAAPAAPDASAAVAARAPDPAPWVAPVRERANPSFNCRYARSTSEEMVCGDPQLAAADRRLSRAYDRAVASGIPARELRAEQDDWLEIREHAARRSPRAVASVYEQRIRELNDLADGY